MARTASKVPTELELEILRQLWDRQPMSGKQVVESLKPNREITYQAVMTMLGVMESKGYVNRQRVDGCFVYQARVTAKATSKRMLQDLVHKLFDGSASAAVLNLLDISKLSSEELEELRKKVDSHQSGDEK